MTERVIDIRGLRKSYGDLEAVAGIDLHVDRGEVFALLGPNGAGKTTTTEILEGYRVRTAGEVASWVMTRPRRSSDEGAHRHRARSRPGSTRSSPCARRSRCMAATTREPSHRRGDRGRRADRKGGRAGAALSGGQQRRLDVAIALAGNPELLFLDEPTTGFDPSARAATPGRWCKNLVSLGKTVWLTTHFMDEAQYLADRVAVIAKGAIVAEGPPALDRGPRPDANLDPVPPTGGAPDRPLGSGARMGTASSSWRPMKRPGRCTRSRAGRSTRGRVRGARGLAAHARGRLSRADGRRGGRGMMPGDCDRCASRTRPSGATRPLPSSRSCSRCCSW